MTKGWNVPNTVDLEKFTVGDKTIKKSGIDFEVQSIDTCKDLCKTKNECVLYGFRNKDHPNPRYKKTCFFKTITKEEENMKKFMETNDYKFTGDNNDNIHEVHCMNGSKTKNSCWKWCAPEGGQCKVKVDSGMAMVKYGRMSHGKFNTFDKVQNVSPGQDVTINCNNNTFGDPIRGKKKSCWVFYHHSK